MQIRQERSDGIEEIEKVGTRRVGVELTVGNTRFGRVLVSGVDVINSVR
jgi:hypothetical protein